MSESRSQGWFHDPRNGRKVFWAVCVVCAGLLIPDLFYHKHAHYAWEGWFGFYGVFGFIACFFLVITAKQLRKLLMRDEDYYDR